MLVLYYFILRFASALPMTNIQFISYINQKCTWEFHCLNDPCITFNDCDGQLTCSNNICNIDLSSIFPSKKVIPADIPIVIQKVIPTDIQEVIPTDIPTNIPTNIPTDIPTDIQKVIPNIPTVIQKVIPTDIPTDIPTNIQVIPTNVPTVIQKVIIPLVKKPISKGILPIIQQPIPTVISKVIPPIIQQPIPTSVSTTVPIVPITSGRSATITYFTDQSFQCISGQPTGNAMAVNPLLLGFTAEQYTASYANTDPSAIPWCNKQLTVTVNGKSFSGEIIDTCDPVGNPFTDPKTGKIIGGKCDYDFDIDLYGQPGLDFLNSITNGNDFFDGTNSGLTWTLN